MLVKSAMIRTESIGFLSRLKTEVLAVPEFAEQDIAATDCRSVNLRFRLLCPLIPTLAVIILGLSIPSRAQTPPGAPVLQSDSRLFALGSPRPIGVFPRIYGVKWRRDGGAFAFFGLSRPLSPVTEKKALLRGETVPPDDEPGLLVYDLDTARLQTIGKFQASRDKEYFLTAEWVGPKLYVETGIPPTEEVPNPNYRLYLYDLKAERATLLEEIPASGTLETSHEDAPFMMERFIEGKTQRFRMIADGKVISLPLGEDKESFGLWGWSLDGKAYYVHGERTEGGGTALEVRYETGEVKVKRVNFNGRGDLFAAQPEAEPLLAIRREKTFPSPGLISLVGKAEGLQAKDA